MYRGLMRVLGGKKLDDVTIGDVTDASGVSRATFYRNFDDIPDILYWKSSAFFRDTFEMFAARKPALNSCDLLPYTLTAWMDESRRELIRQLVINGRTDIICNSFTGCSDIILELLDRQDEEMTESEKNYYISMKAGAFVGLMRGWVLGGCSQSFEEMLGDASCHIDGILERRISSESRRK